MGDNARLIAGIRDLSEYDNIPVTLEKYLNDSLIKIYNFEKTEIDNKESGIFYNPYQKVYAAVTYNELDAAPLDDRTYTYKVKIINNSGVEVGTSISLVGEKMDLRKPAVSTNPNSPSIIIFSKNPIFTTKFEWDTVANAAYYKVDANLVLTELLSNGEIIDRTVIWNNIFESKQNESDKGKLVKEISGASFFTFILQKVPHSNEEKENNVVKRRVKNITFNYEIASKDLYNYMSLTSGTYGLILDMDTYSNVNDGLGLIASRTSYSYTYNLAGATLNVIYFEPQYSHLKFGTF